jgi:UDP-sugar transporter A1/2/3
MHYSRIMPPVNGQRYFTSTAVFLNEVLKLCIAGVIAFRDTSRNLEGAPFSTITRTLYNQAFSSDSWKLAIPAALYTFQNSLQYIAVSNLDAATFQVTYQLKILTTAIFSVTMLRRRLSAKQWVSLVLLMAGVAIVSVLPSVGPDKSGQTGKKATRDLQQNYHAKMNPTVGLFAVITACATSGLAGVYFEKVLKDSTKVTLWVRNVQMSFYSLFPALFIGVVMKDGREIRRDGFFAGYNNMVWAAIVCQAVGGLLVAVVVNYADNIAKNFATSISIILSFIASVWLFDFKITFNVRILVSHGSMLSDCVPSFSSVWDLCFTPRISTAAQAQGPP